MKMIGTILSSLVMGFNMAANGFSPLVELQRLLDSRGRILYASALAATGFIFTIAGFLIGLIEGALQYDAQGFVFWSALFSVATFLFIGGVGLLVLAKLTMPQILPANLNVANFGRPQNAFMPMLENVLKSYFEGMSQSTAPTGPEVPMPPPPAATAPTPEPTTTYMERERPVQTMESQLSH